MTTFLSGDKNMYEAYDEGKDLYAMIAQSAFNNNYEDNLEYYPVGHEVEIDGKKAIAGDGKEYCAETDADNGITVKRYELLPTVDGDIPADRIKPGDRVISDIGELMVLKAVKTESSGEVTVIFAK